MPNIDPEKEREYQKLYREKNKEKLKEYHRIYGLKNKDRRKEYLKTNKDKVREWHRNNYLKHRERMLSEKKKIYYMDIEKSRATAREAWYRNREKYIPAVRARTLKNRIELINAYGGSCSCCGEDEIRFLTLEHLNRDGKIHREKVGGSTGVYYDLRKRGYPKDGYTILCANCNFSESLGTPCPHKLIINKAIFGAAA
jgi:hypothetical protein